MAGGINSTKTMNDNLKKQQELTDRLDMASVLYYQGKTSEFTDTEFDLHLHELQRMENESGVVFPNSPTNRVGSDIQDGFKKGKHPIPMLTIENTYDDDGLRKWLKKVYNLGATSICAGIKYDGISCELKYEDGYLTQALTRGDKNIGDDITENVKTIRNIPLKLPVKTLCNPFYVRGEVLLPKSSLKALNEAKIANNETPFANTRNACSGSLKQLDPKVTASRGLIFKPWGFVFTDDKRRPNLTTSYSEEHGVMRFYNYYAMMCDSQLGFDFTPGLDSVSIHFVDENSIDDVVKVISDYREHLKLNDLDFDYDGVVVKVNDLGLQEKIGTKDTRSIEWGIARKWNEDYAAKTIIEDVEWSVGKTGAITPVGILQPVEIDGVVVSRVTLNNKSFIENLGICYGDELSIVRSGGVIPYVVGVNKHYGDSPITFPCHCPQCGADLKMVGEETFCQGGDYCPAKIKGKLQHWCSKDCLDIQGIGDSVIDTLFHMYIHKPYDLYRLLFLEPTELAEDLGEGYGVKKAAKIQEALKKSIEKPLENIIYGLSIDGVGKVTARLLVDTFGTWDEIMCAPVDVLKRTPGIGDVLAESIHNWFNDLVDDPEAFTREVDENYDQYFVHLKTKRGELWKERLQSLGFRINEKKETKQPTEQPLQGLTLVFTGKSNRFPGDGVEKYLESLGAKTSHSVSKNTNYLITGEKPGGGKLSKATDCGVEVIEEENFYSKFNLKPEKQWMIEN